MSKARPKTIQIYLPDGNPQHIRIAEITSRTVQLIAISRSQIEDGVKRSELEGVGVYFLFGENEAEEQTVYIGESENCLTRLKQHHKMKDFWDTAVVVVSKTQFFTKAHVKYLEWFCIQEAQKNEEFFVENGNNSSKPFLQEPVEADLEDNFETIRLLIATLGYPLFENSKKVQSKSNLIYCKKKDISASAIYMDEGIKIRVLKGSQVFTEDRNTFGNWENLKDKLISQQVLELDDKRLVFTKDYVFKSPSAAAAVILGRSSNGWIEWKYEDGRTLDEVKRKNG